MNTLFVGEIELTLRVKPDLFYNSEKQRLTPVFHHFRTSIRQLPELTKAVFITVNTKQPYISIQTFFEYSQNERAAKMNAKQAIQAVLNNYQKEKGHGKSTTV